jgi:hypothetical protein
VTHVVVSRQQIASFSHHSYIEYRLDLIQVKGLFQTRFLTDSTWSKDGL